MSSTNFRKLPKYMLCLSMNTGLQQISMSLMKLQSCSSMNSMKVRNA